MAVLAIGSLPLPRPLSELASRQELTTWLTRVLLAKLVSGRSKEPPFKIRMPHGLVAFFALLLHLYRVGYPGHWLSDFLKCVPFSVGVPPNWARSASDLCVLEAKVRPARIFSTRWEDPSPPFAPGVNVLFYDPQVFSPGAKSLILSIPDILEGRKDPPPGSVYILTSVESLDYLIHVRWRMSRQRYAHMKAERWVMVLYRKDTYEQGECHIRKAESYGITDGFSVRECSCIQMGTIGRRCCLRLSYACNSLVVYHIPYNTHQNGYRPYSHARSNCHATHCYTFTMLITSAHRHTDASIAVARAIGWVSQRLPVNTRLVHELSILSRT